MRVLILHQKLAVASVHPVAVHLETPHKTVQIYLVRIKWFLGEIIEHSHLVISNCDFQVLKKSDMFLKNLIFGLKIKEWM